jgi:SAM-dependent methyltransferase
MFVGRFRSAAENRPRLHECIHAVPAENRVSLSPNHRITGRAERAVRSHMTHQKSCPVKAASLRKQMALLLIAAWVAIGSCRTVPGRDVRYEPTAMPVVRAMLELAAVGAQDVVYDLGSGDGRIPIVAAKEFGARGVGIEIDPALVAQARANARAAGVADRVEFRVGDMYEADVRPATVVTLFLHPKPNLKLRPKLRSELRPGSRVVSYIWDMGDWRPEQQRSVGKKRIFLWRIPSKPSPGP